MVEIRGSRLPYPVVIRHRDCPGGVVACMVNGSASTHHPDMHKPYYPWGIESLFNQRPTIGWLIELGEQNYRSLIRLVPEVRTMAGHYSSCLAHSMDLYLEVQEQTPYTSLVHLTYYFSHYAGQQPDPDATIRLYHDSRQAEVMDLQQRVLPLKRGGEWPTLAQKWRANLFLNRWLSYCLAQGHGFEESDEWEEGPPGSRANLATGS